MANPVSVPFSQPQPNQLSYGIELLALFQSYTRESYFSTFGVEAPPWNPARPRKAWFDSSLGHSDPAAVHSYQFLAPDQGGNWAVQSFQLGAAEAAAINLPGSFTFPPYLPAPTGTNRGGTPVSPVYLSSVADAEALLLELKGASLFDDGMRGLIPVVYPPDEQRRMWAINFSNGQQLNVGLLLGARNANGVGSPGHWDLSSGSPVWVADPPAPAGLDDTRSPRPVPVRALLPNEALCPVMTAIGPVGVQVVRTDLERKAAEQSGAFLPSDRAMIEQILHLLTPNQTV